MQVLLYSSGDVWKAKQTGGIKRFRELLGSPRKGYDLTLCCPNLDKYEHGDYGRIQLNETKPATWKKLFPPEMRLLLSNIKPIKEIKKKGFDRVISFDVPPTIGLVLLNVKNIVLMIRKDMIGYEQVMTKKKSIGYYAKIAFQWFCESVCMARVRMITCQCEYDKEVLKKRHPLLRKRIERITKIQINNVNPSWVVRNSQFAPLFRPGNEMRVCFIGDFDNPRKGHNLMLEVAKKICSDTNVFKFIMVGGGEELKQYEQAYSCDGIEFTGMLSNPISVLKGCDLLVVPSLADSCPNTVMEALYNEIPVIGSRAGGIPEILNDDNSLFDLNEESLYEKIIQLKDKKRLDAIKTFQARRRKELEFDWGKKMMSIIIS